MNQRSKNNQLDNKGCQQGLPTLETVGNPLTQGLPTENQELATLEENPDVHGKNQGLPVGNPMMGNQQPRKALGVANSPLPPLRGEGVGNPENAPATFAQLTEFKQRLNNGVEWCRRHRANPDQQQRGIDRYNRLLVNEYLPAIRAHRNNGHDYNADLATIEKRITTGADTAGHDELFTELLTTYEVIYDITHNDATARHVDRMEYVKSS